MKMIKEILALIDESLKLNGRTCTFNADTKLLGSLPELDSLGVVNILTVIEIKFNIKIEDDEIDGSVFKTVGSLANFVEKKV